MKKICVYTCLTGNYDNLHEVEIVDKEVDFICYTNNKNLESKTWNVIYIDNEGLTDHQLSRKIKMLGTDYINDNYEISVWQDASVIWNKKPSLFVKKYLKKNNFASFKHFYRDCVYKEAVEIIRARKETKEAIVEHVNFLRKEGFPENYGLYEMTIFIKNNKDEKVKETMQLWYKTYYEHSKRDQMSFMYATWKTGLKIDTINLNVWNNEWVYHTKHNSSKKLTNCRVFYGDSTIDTNYNYNLDHIYKYKINGDKYTVDATIPVDTNVIEIDISNVPCIKYSDFEISLPCKQVYFFNTIEYDGSNIFYNDKGIVRLEGKFKAKRKLKFSIRIEYLDENDKYNLINKLSTDLIILSEDNNSMKYELERINKMKKSIFYKLYKVELKLKRIVKKNK